MKRMMNMKRQFTRSLAIVAVAGLLLFTRSAVTAQVQDKSAAALKAAMDKETLDGDLKGAIEQYKKIADSSKDRSIAAKALVRMAECYQKLGNAESRKIYERIVKDYADQKDAVTLARVGLGGSTSTGMNSRLVWSASTQVLWNVGTISADGRYVSSAGMLPQNLAIHELATGADRHIPPNEAAAGKSSGSAGESAISKDGKRVAYQWCDNKRCELRLANLTGAANPQHLYDNPDIAELAPFDWTPDGKSVAVQVERKDGTIQLGLVSVPEGSLRVLKSVDWRGSGRMFFSPDGRWLGFDLPENSVSPERDVFVLSVDGSREIHAVDHRGQDEMAGWSPDGKWLLFTSDRTQTKDLWAIPFGAAGSLGSPQLLKAGFQRSTPLGVTTSGVLYYTQETGGGPSRIQIASVDIAAGKLTAPVELSQNYRYSDRNPQWSPDGKRIAYVTVRGRQVLVIRSNETGQIRELQPDLTYFRLDSWATGGRSLIVQGTDPKGRFGFYAVNAETGDLKALGLGLDVGYSSRVILAPDERSFLVETTGSRPALHRVDVGTGDASEVMPFPPGQPALPGLYPSWSQDGKSFYYRRVFVSNDARPREEAIVERNLSSGAERELARRPSLFLPKLTSDGRYIVAVSLSKDSRALLLIPIAGGEPRELLRVPPEVGLSPFLPTPDSRSVLILKSTRERIPGSENFRVLEELWLIPLGGGEPKKIGSTPEGFAQGTMAVSPDGSHLAYIITDAGSQPTTELWALENFLPRSVAGR